MQRTFIIALGLFLAGIACLAQAQIPNVKFFGTCSQLGNDQFTKLLVHADGTNGATAFKDSSKAAHALTANGSANLITAVKKFGTAAANLPTTGNYVTSPASADWFLSTDLWTIDFEANYATWPTFGHANATIWSQSASNGWILNFGTTSMGQTIVDLFMISGGISVGEYLWVVTPNTGVFDHWEVSRSGSSFFLFQNGTPISTTVITNLGTGSIPDSGDVLNIGNRNAPFDTGVTLDEVRLSRGIVRHTSAFQRPVAAYCP